MSLINSIKKSFRQLRWKLTLSYTIVTVGALLLAMLILGSLLFSTILIPHQFMPPDFWIGMLTENVPPYFRYLLEQSPVDTELLSLMLMENEREKTTPQSMVLW